MRAFPGGRGTATVHSGQVKVGWRNCGPVGMWCSGVCVCVKGVAGGTLKRSIFLRPSASVPKFASLLIRLTILISRGYV